MALNLEMFESLFRHQMFEMLKGNGRFQGEASRQTQRVSGWSISRGQNHLQSVRGFLTTFFTTFDPNQAHGIVHVATQFEPCSWAKLTPSSATSLNMDLAA
jgi:hypothetical protein